MGEEGKKLGQLAKTYTYLAIYISLSSTQIFFNKWILSDPRFNFPYPVALTLLHMVFSSVLCFLVMRVFKIVKLQTGMTLQLYFTSIVPIGAMFAVTLWLGNTAYLYISVSFAQMLKAVMPVAVFVLGAAVGLEALTWRMFVIMSIISMGVLVASYGEVNFNFLGVIYQLGGVAGEASRLILSELLLKKKGVRFDPLSMMYYISPCSAACLLVPWIFLEKPLMAVSTGATLPEPFTLVLNALCTFALNVSVFLVILHTSALTARVAGVVKDWIVVLVSALLFADTKLTAINILGYAIAIAGVVMYNRHKLHVPVTQVGSSNTDSLGEEDEENPQSQKETYSARRKGGGADSLKEEMPSPSPRHPSTLWRKEEFR